MSQSSPLPSFLWELFLRLRRRGFVVGPQDYEALLLALNAGFGWSSQQALKELCAKLWAKSYREQETLFVLFDQLAPVEEAWELERDVKANNLSSSKDEPDSTSLLDLEEDDESDHNKTESELPQAHSRGGLPPISLKDVKVAERPFVLEPQYPVTYREVAQAWRRLRRPTRTGPPIELDIEGTIEKCSRVGVASSLVMRPRRRNIAKVLLLIDRKGSMTPFHGFCDEVCTAMQEAGRFEELPVFYFQNSPAEGADDSVLESDALEDIFFPPLDPVLPEIKPVTEGDLYLDPELYNLISLEAVLKNHANDASVVILSDAGAARKQFNAERLLNTIAFFKALRAHTTRYVWLNPLPKNHWDGSKTKSTATALSRHIPMFSLNRRGLHQAVNVLRGQPYTVEKPL
ncbi:hypothetical protein [Halomicronema sp. CCY15110]|uniref:hypothetical protein n=1 Tax=Halomicronema sp. CCY15110 TaxID=2767773 RepID=UPI00194E3F6E|nr:hypothetical protein [Halomicronema sp. CCY15110]